MGKATYEVLEIRFVIKPELTEAFFFFQGHGDVPLGVTGWHHKTFPASVAVIDIIKAHGEGKEDPLLWPLEAPE